MHNKRVHVTIEGRVQGVYFRAYTQEEAERLDLNGWVRNRPDGSVEAVFEGPPEEIEKMIDWCWKGSPHSSVSQVTVQEETPTGHTDGFSIRY